MNAQVDQVRRMAEAMETISSCVVDPVLCITGHNAHAFGTDQLIRGVHVVAVDRIAHWLASRERTLPDADVHDVPGCTRCDAARFFSYRRDGANAGRHLAAIAVRS